MSIKDILKKQKKRRQLKEVENDPKFGVILSTLREEQSNYLNELKEGLEANFNTFKATISDGEPGADADNDKIIKEVLSKIPKPKDGKTPIAGKDFPLPKDGNDADEDNILKRLFGKFRQPKDGDDGYTPIKGKDYFDGESIKGEPGSDGSPDTPLQIADKLNTKEEIVDMSVIKGFKKLIRSLQRAIQDSKSKAMGGGMGNVVHETFTVGTTTTSVTLKSGIAAGGNAIWARYQGQMLVKDEHYTISGKTIDLTPITASFENNTFIDVTYMRA